MHILIVHNSIIPVTKYGGTERVIYWLGKALIQLNHKITFLLPIGSKCSFANIIFYNDKKDIDEQIPDYIDIVHLQTYLGSITKKPFVITLHGNVDKQIPFDKNTIFVSKNHAERYNSSSFVYNGIDCNDYGKPDFNKKHYVHFLGDAAWRIKNVKGAIDIACKANIPIKILGGKRLNIFQGFRFTTSKNASFYGMVGGMEKIKLLNASKGLVFPILWHEPFGIALIESLYFGCPVFATPYGSLPEIINNEIGFLSNISNQLTEAVKNVNDFDSVKCHDYVMSNFTADIMAKEYLKKYELVLNGNSLNNESPCLKKLPEEKFLPYY